MKSLLQRAVEHAQPDRIRRIEVPEWGDPEVLDKDGEVVTPAEPLTIFYKMVTLEDLHLVHELDGTSWHKQAARIVALKSQDAQGDKLFKMVDTAMLREQAAPDVINRIAIAMLGRMSVEDAAKN